MCAAVGEWTFSESVLLCSMAYKSLCYGAPHIHLPLLQTEWGQNSKCSCLQIEGTKAEAWNCSL